VIAAADFGIEAFIRRAVEKEAEGLLDGLLTGGTQ
jgi:hypothetical protein